MAVIQFVDQVDEAARGVFVQGIEARDAAHQHRVELVRDLDVVRGAAGTLAQRREIEPGDAFATATHRDLAAVDLDVAAVRGFATAEFAPAHRQPVVGRAVQRRPVHRRAGQRAQAVVFLPVRAQHHAVRLQQVDRRQEARALKAILVQVLRRGIGGRHQGDAFGEHALQQARQQHRIADVGDEELVQHQHAQLAACLAHDLRQRIAFARVFAQPFVHAAHEAVEVRAVLAAALAVRLVLRHRIRRQRQGVVEQVDQEGLAAADFAPVIQALDGFRWLAEQPAEQAGRRRLRQQGRMDAVEFGQRGMLRRIVLPLAFRGAACVDLRRRRSRLPSVVRHHAGT